MPEADVIVAAKVTDQPHPVPGSTIAWCDICADEVWMSPTSRRHFESGDAATVRCFDCTMGTAPPDAEFAVFDEDAAVPERVALVAEVNEAHRSGALRAAHENRKKTQTP